MAAPGEWQPQPDQLKTLAPHHSCLVDWAGKVQPFDGGPAGSLVWWREALASSPIAQAARLPETSMQDEDDENVKLIKAADWGSNVKALLLSTI